MVVSKGFGTECGPTYTVILSEERIVQSRSFGNETIERERREDFGHNGCTAVPRYKHLGPSDVTVSHEGGRKRF